MVVFCYDTSNGLAFAGRSILAAAYADDVSLGVSDEGSIIAYIALSERFQKATGLAINTDKSWILPLGPRRQLPHEIGGIRVIQDDTPHRLLGLFRGFSQKPC